MQADSPALVATLPNGNTPSTTAAAAVAVTAADEQYYRRLCSDLRSQNKALEQSCQQDLALLEAARSQLRHSRLEQNFLFSMLSRVRPDEATILKKQQRQQRLQSIQLNQQQMESGMDAMSMMDINDNSNNMAFGDNSIVDFDMDDYMLNDANTIATASTTAAVAGSGGSYGNLLELGNGTPSSSMMGLAPLTVAPSRGASRSSGTRTPTAQHLLSHTITANSGLDPALLVNPGISTPSSVTGSGTASRRGGGGGAGSKSSKDPSRQPTNAYFMFCKVMRSQVKERIGASMPAATGPPAPGTSIGVISGISEVNKQLGQMWRAMSKKERSVYHDMLNDPVAAAAAVAAANAGISSLPVSTTASATVSATTETTAAPAETTTTTAAITATNTTVNSATTGSNSAVMTGSPMLVEHGLDYYEDLSNMSGVDEVTSSAIQTPAERSPQMQNEDY